MPTVALIPLHDMEDAELVRLAMKQTPQAFDMLVKRYLKPVYSFILHYVKDPGLAEDLTQETFVRVYRSIRQFDKRRAFKPWLYTIALNVSKTALKRNQKQPLLLNEDSSAMNLLENIADTGDSEKMPGETGENAPLHQALEKLNPTVREAILLRYMQDLSYEEIAETMGANLNTVRTWLKRGRETLKTLLEQQRGEL